MAKAKRQFVPRDQVQPHSQGSFLLVRLRSEIERGPEEDTGNERLGQVSFTVRFICTKISSCMSGSSVELIST